MTPDEIKALKPGDEVLIRATVVETIDDDGDMWVAPHWSGEGDSRFNNSYANAIHAKAPPKPKPLGIGDRVHSGDLDPMTIVAIHGDEAWCEWGSAHLTYNLCHLGHLPVAR